MLQAAEKSGSVRRIVFTQAAAGLVDSEDGDTLGTRMEKVLDGKSLRPVTRQKRTLTCTTEHVQVNQPSLHYRPPLKSAHNAYCAAKAQCMTTLNGLRLSNSLPFSIAQVIPGTVIGTSEFATTAAQAFAHMDRQTKALVFDGMQPRYAFGFVHVHDCARIHIEALDERKVSADDLPPWFIAAATTPEGFDGPRTWSEAVSAMEKEFPHQIEQGVFKLGREKVPMNMPYRVDSRHTERLLLGGAKIRGFEESAKEVARWYVGLKEGEKEKS